MYFTKEDKIKAIKNYLDTDHEAMLLGLARAYFPEMDIPDTKAMAEHCVENNDDLYDDEIKEILKGD